jgi:hypothetical protein
VICVTPAKEKVPVRRPLRQFGCCTDTARNMSASLLKQFWSRAAPHRVQPCCAPHRSGTESSQTPRWRNEDSNRWSHLRVSRSAAPARSFQPPAHPSWISNPSRQFNQHLCRKWDQRFESASSSSESGANSLLCRCETLCARLSSACAWPPAGYSR